MSSLITRALLLTLALSSVASAQEPDVDEASEARPSRGGLRDVAAVESSVGIGLISRHLRYNDDVYGFLREYTLPAGAELSFSLRSYPGTWLRRGGIADVFGLELRADRSLGVQSERSNGVRFPTVHRILEANLLLRLARGGHELVGMLGYGHHAFVFERTSPSEGNLDAQPDVPGVGYSYLRIGLEGRVVAHDRLAFVLGAAYLPVLDAGGITSSLWFPRASLGGMTLRARVVVGLMRSLELHAGVEYRRYFFDMNVEPTDRIIAGGALDQYTSSELALVYRY